MAYQPTIIAASLDDAELRQSIDSLVQYVNQGTGQMVSSFNSAIADMKASLMSLNSVKLNPAGTFDGTTSGKAKMSGAAVASYQQDQIGFLRQSIALEKQKLNSIQQNSDAMLRQNAIIAQQKALLRTNTTAMSLDSVLGMPVKSIDDITAKMRALRAVQIDPHDAASAKMVSNAYVELGEKKRSLVGANKQLISSNSALARSFNYIRNRIIYAFAIGGIMKFTRDLYEVRGQYELLERSIGILVDDMRRGSEIFNELNQMALKSPFTLMDLGGAAKQLAAYNFAEDELVDTTRRLADISAALGVPMERLVYNLGQIRAQTVLNARDARDFANAGLAIVPMLAQMYTEQKKFGDEIVTTAQVYDMMKKKMVSYADVMQVINKVTDEGGKFYDFQAKQADTLKVKMANLTLAYNNMMNDIGKEQQSALAAPLKGLKYIFENWRKIANVIKEIIIIYGTYKAQIIAIAAYHKALALAKTVKELWAMWRAMNFLSRVVTVYNAALAASKVLMGAFLPIMAGVIGAVAMFGGKTESSARDLEKFGEAGTKVLRTLDELFTTLVGISKTSSNYGKVLGELNSILSEYGIEEIKEADTIKEVNEKRQLAISLIREEAAERQYLNSVSQSADNYKDEISSITKDVEETLGNKGIINSLWGTYGEVFEKNAPALANIITQFAEESIDTVVNKTGKELDKGIDEITRKIRTRLINLDIGITEEDLNERFSNKVITDAIIAIKKATEARQAYEKAVEAAYREELKAAEASTTFNDRVDRTTNALMKAANDTDKFQSRIKELLRQYGGQNIIDFLVKVKTEGTFPEWMKKMGLAQLQGLAAKFTALATQAQKEGLKSKTFGETTYTIDQLFKRAAEYSAAADWKQEETEARRSSTLISKASEALKDYKEALDAAERAQNKFNRGLADEALVTEKNKDVQDKYNKALEAGVTKKELEEARNRGKGGKKDPLGDALQEELKLIGELQKRYKEYIQSGIGADKAKLAIQEDYNKSLETQNNILKKYGIIGLTSDQIATMSLKEILSYYESILDKVKQSPKAVEAVEKAILNVKSEILKTNQKTLVESLNNELGKLKDEYELALDFEANPELGSVFADMMGISKEELSSLPNDFAKVVEKMQSKVDSILVDDSFNIMENLNKGKFEKWLSERQIELNSNEAAALKKIIDELNKIRQDETKKQVDEWNKLLEKYAEYEYKRKKIMEEAQKERDLANAKGNSDIANAATIREQRELAKLDFEQFQQSPTWIAATGDLATMANSAIDMLIDRLEEYKKSAKNLDPKQIKQINNALKQLHRQQRQNNPFTFIANAIDEAKDRVDDYQIQIDAAEARLTELNKKKAEGIRLTEAEEREYDGLYLAISRWIEEMEQAGKVSATSIVKGLQDMLSAINQVTSGLGEMFAAFGDEETQKQIQKVTSTLEKGLSFAAMGASIGGKSAGGWGAAIGGVVGLLVGGLTAWADEMSGNAAITDKIKESERELKRIAEYYKDIEDAASKAYGVETLGAKEALAANKKLQLVELQRQLQLEESRNEKYRDEDRILEIKSQIHDLQLEIKNSTRDIVDDLLGISSYGDEITSLVEVMIDAFRNGEDAMEAFGDKWDEMIDNMILKLIVSTFMQKEWDKIMAYLEQKEKEFLQKSTGDKTSAETELSIISGMTNDEIAKRIAEQLGYTKIGGYGAEIKKLASEAIKRGDLYINPGMNYDSPWYYSIEAWQQVSDEEIAAYRARIEQMIKNAEAASDGAEAQYTQWALDYMSHEGRDIMTERARLLEQGLADFYHFGENEEGKALSNLQQGIQGITEDTASALEAYMNGVSQQVYLHSDLLTQIRDTIVGWDMDVNLGVQAEMLLQLQNSYQVQMTIQNILQGWNNSTGMAVRVEMV